MNNINNERTKRPAGEDDVNAARLAPLFTQRVANHDHGNRSIDPALKRQLMVEFAAYLCRLGEYELDQEELERWIHQFLLERPDNASGCGDTERVVLKEDSGAARSLLREDQDGEDCNKAAERDLSSATRSAHSSLQEFYLAARLWHGLKNETLDVFDQPLVSLEALDLLGQLAKLEPDRQQAQTLEQISRILGGDCLRAATLAFRYWLRAIELNLPVPQPAFVNLAGANLEEWNIRGRSAAQPLNLRGARLTGVKLNRARMEWVDLANADLTGCELRQTVLQHVSAPNSTWVSTDLSGLQWRRGSLIGANLQDSKTRCELLHVGLTGAEISPGWEARTNASLPSDMRRRGPVPFAGHCASVASCAWSPDGASLLSASADKTLRVWDAVSGECRLTLNGHTWRVSSGAWSPDGACLLSGSFDGTLKVWDAISGECRLTLNGHDWHVTSCVWSPDGASLLSASADKTLKVWDANSGVCRLTLHGHANRVSSCVWSPDGTSLLSASHDKTLRIWDAVSGECRLTLNGHTSSITSCAWSPDGASLLSASDDKTLKVWDAVSGECRLTLYGHTSRVSSCGWSCDGASLLSASDDNGLRIWDAVSESVDSRSTDIRAESLRADGVATEPVCCLHL
ncbi:MAG: pentapeptide repeat-containing protein [Planctomycetaceae bacterium]